MGNTLVGSTTIRNKWDYDVAARLGVAFGQALVYGKAGSVAGRFDWNQADINCGPSCSTTQGRSTLDGLSIGLGLEYAFATNWTAKFEYDYLGFGAKNVAFALTQTCGPLTACPLLAATQIQSVSADKHIFKVGLNYLFNVGGPAVVARY